MWFWFIGRFFVWVMHKNGARFDRIAPFWCASLLPFDHCVYASKHWRDWPLKVTLGDAPNAQSGGCGQAGCNV